MASTLLTCRKIRLGYLTTTISLIFLYILCHNNVPSVIAEPETSEEYEYLLPTVVIATLVRNKAHTLPWFLGLVEKLNYPKDRISLWISSDHNVDNSSAILQEWLAGVSHLYHKVEAHIDDKKEGYPGEISPCEWTEDRFSRVIKLRQQALDYARTSWADYIFMIDADVTLENPDTLQTLMRENRFIIGPMLNCSIEGFYSNFWGGMSDKGYYKRSEEYLDIVARETFGVFSVPMVHTALLINLHHVMAPRIAYTPSESYDGPIDDIIIFALGVKSLGQTMYVSNIDYFGKVMFPLSKDHSLEDDHEHFAYVKLEAMVEEVPPLYSSPHVYVPDIPKSKLGFDEIYMINLKRRPARRTRMLKALEYLGIDAKVVDAVDGKELNDSYLEQVGIKMLPGFADPYHGRPMTMGEIGCFLSHYHVWEEVLAKKYKKIIVFEDDVRFESYFNRKLTRLMSDVNRLFDAWDLIYLGRKRLQKDYERMVQGSEFLAWPRYSYWTISYMLSYRGAQKLLAQNPLTKMVPVDEYLPIMFDQHPEDSWRLKFHPRNLLSLSAEPFLLFPSHYTGEPNYFSDTEDSVTVPKEKTVAEDGVKVVDGAVDDGQEQTTLLGEGAGAEDANLFMGGFQKKDEL